MQRVMDEEKINRLIDAILVMQEQEDTTTPALRSQLAETESSIGNILKAIERAFSRRPPSSGLMSWKHEKSL